MLIVSPVKSEGVINLDHIVHMQVAMMMAADHEQIFTLKFVCISGHTYYLGEWKTKEAADSALEEIIKCNHCGNKEVYLN